MKKKLLILLTVLVLTLLPVISLAQTAELTEADYIRIAGEAYRAQVDISDEDFAALTFRVDDTVLEGHSGMVKTVVMSLDFDDSSYGIAVVTLEPRYGSLLNVELWSTVEQARRYREGFQVHAEWEATKGPEYKWSQQDIVDYYAKYMNGEYKMDGAGDLPHDDAIAIAKKYCKDTWGMTDEHIATLVIQANLQSDGLAWAVVLFDESLKNVDGLLVNHFMQISNPGGEVQNAYQGDPNSRG